MNKLKFIFSKNHAFSLWEAPPMGRHQETFTGRASDSGLLQPWDRVEIKLPPCAAGCGALRSDKGFPTSAPLARAQHNSLSLLLISEC